MLNNSMQLEELISLSHDNICEITAIKNNKIVYENYRNGFKENDALNIMSVTKSVISLLVFIAIDKGYVKDVNQKVMDFFTDYTVKRGEKTIYDVTIKHLLTMTAPYKYKSEPWTKVCTSDDWTKAALDILGGRAGITGEFKYSTLGIQILSGIIKNASGMQVLDFANKFLFEPLNIPIHTNAAVTSKESQFEFLMSKNAKDNVWIADPIGTNTAGWGLCLSSRDMAKIGQMCLNKGEYNAQKILSEKSIKEIFTPRVQCDERFANMQYGYLWWIIDDKNKIYAAIGDGGNVIYINAIKNIVVSVTATFKPRVFNRIDLIHDSIEPLIDNM